MKTRNGNFDSRLTKTLPSRSLNFLRSSSKGFTLIELLVVISIIALLSTVVLGALADARTSGRNAAKNESIRQYVNALELYRASNNGYPVFGNGEETPSTDDAACLGYGASETCFGIYSVSGEDALNTALAPFFGGTVAKNTASVPAGGFGDLKGILYSCRNSADCTSYKIRWALEKPNQKCGQGAVESANHGGATRCFYQN